MYNLETAAAATAGMGGISINPDGTADAFYAEKKAWHGLGHNVENCLTLDELVEKGCIQFEVEKRRHAVNMGTAENPLYMPIGSYGMYRTDRKDEAAFLGEVGKNYEPIQNIDMLGLGVAACEHAGTARFSNAGSLYGGQVVFATIDLRRSIEVAGDVTLPYLVIMTSHNGSIPLSIGTMLYRPDCMNMAAAAYKTIQQNESEGTSARLRHTKLAQERLVEVKNMVASNMEFIDGLHTKFAALSGKRIQPNDGIVEKTLDHVFRLNARTKKGSEGNELTNQAKTLIAEISDIFWNNKNNMPNAIKHTAAGLFQSVTYMTNHLTRPKMTDKALQAGYSADSLRQIGMLLPTGTGYKDANSAFEYLLKVSA